MRVVLRRGRLHLLYIFRSIAGKRVLRLVGVVEVQVGVVSTNAYSVFTNPVDKVRTRLLEERILLGALPSDVWLVYWRWSV